MDVLVPESVIHLLMDTYSIDYSEVGTNILSDCVRLMAYFFIGSGDDVNLSS